MYQGPGGWDNFHPSRDAYNDPSFNSYVSRPPMCLQGQRKYGNSNTRQKNTSLYVGGIPLELSEEGITNLFSRSGQVVNVKIMRSKTLNARDTYGFVRMASVGDAERAIRDMNGFEVEGFRFRVKMSLSDEERSRRKEEERLMQGTFFNEEVESDTEERFLNQQSQYKENQPLLEMNGFGGHPDNYLPKGRGRGQVLSEITGSYGDSWGVARDTVSAPVSPRQPGSYPRGTQNGLSDASNSVIGPGSYGRGTSKGLSSASVSPRAHGSFPRDTQPDNYVPTSGDKSFVRGVSRGMSSASVSPRAPGSYGRDASHGRSSASEGPASFLRSGQGPGPGGDNLGNMTHGDPTRGTGLLQAPPIRNPKNPMENLTITVDRDNHRNLSRMNEKITLMSLNRSMPVTGGNSATSIQDINRGIGLGRGGNRFIVDQQTNMDYRGQPDVGFRGRGRGNPMLDGMDMYSAYPTQPGGYHGLGRGGPMPGSYQPPQMQGINQRLQQMASPGQTGLLQPVHRPGPNLNSTTYDEMQKPQNKEIQTSKPVPEKPKKKAEPSVAACTHCGKPGSNRCGACKSPYCSAECQVADWPEHKRICKSISKEREVAEEFESQFDVNVGDDLIPEVQKLMEFATGDKIEVTKKDKVDDTKNRQRNHSDGSDKTSRSGGQRSDKQEVNLNKTVMGNERDSKDRKGRGQKMDGYETDIGTDRRARNRKTDAAGYETDVGRDKRACFNCGETSHVRSDCPKPHGYNSVCYNCQTKGHLSRECPLKQGNAGQNSQSGQRSNLAQQPRTSKPASSNHRPAAASANDDWDDDKEPAKPASKSGLIPAPLAHSTPIDEHRTKDRQVGETPVKGGKQELIPVAELPMDKEVLVVVTEAINIDEIWIQDVEQTLPLQDTMLAMMEKFHESACDIRLNEVKVGNYYGAQFTDGAWYRVCVKNLMRQGDIEVHYIDFGNTEMTKINKLRQLESSMMKDSAKAILCTLDGIDPKLSSSIDNTILKKHVVADKPYQAVCKKIVKKGDRKTFHITLKNEAEVDVVAAILQEVKSTVQKQETVKNVSPSVLSMVFLIDIPSAACRLEIGQKYGALFAYVPSPNEFTVQIIDLDNQTEFTKFDEKLQDYYNKDNKPYRPSKQGEVIVSKYSDDNKWYRAEVTQINKNDVDVVFIDYGNSEKTPFDACRKITTEFTRMERKSVTCCLYKLDIPAEIPAEIVALFQFFSSNIVMIEVKDVKQDVHAIELFTEDGQSYSDEMRALLGQTVEPKLSEKKKMPQKEEKMKVETKTEDKSVFLTDIPSAASRMKPGQKYGALFAFVPSPNEFTVQIVDTDNQTEFTKFDEKLQAYYNKDNQPYRPSKQGEVIVSKYSDDNKWYRAEVTQINKNDVDVVFIDYGNSEKTPFDACRKITSEFTRMERKSVTCCLYKLDIPAEIPAEIVALFQFFSSNIVMIEVKDVKQDVHAIELFTEDGQSYSDEMRALLGQTVEPKQSEKKKTPQKEEKMKVENKTEDKAVFGTDIPSAASRMKPGQKYGALFAFVPSPNKFTVQIVDTDNQTEFTKFDEKLQDHYNKDNQPYRPSKQGEVIVSKYSDDNKWYRAEVTQINQNDVDVIFIDYGNSEKTPFDACRKITSEFTRMERKSVTCCLYKLDIPTEIPAEIVALFQYFSSNIVMIEVKDVKQDVHAIELFTEDGQSYSDEMRALLGQTVEPKQSEKMKTPQKEEQMKVETKTEDKSVFGTDIPSAASRMKPGQKYGALFAFVPSPNLFTVQIVDADNQTEFTKFDEKLQDYYNKDNQPYRPSKQGEVIVSKYSDDNKWYRAEVTQINQNDVDVVFIDYGNSEKTPYDACRKITSEFTRMERKSVTCCLYKLDIPAEIPAEIVALFQFFSSNIVMIEVKDVKQDVHAIELFTEDGLSYSDEMRALLGQTVEPKQSEKTKTPEKSKVETEAKPVPMKEKGVEIKYGELEINKAIEVVPSDIRSLRLFNVRISSEENSQQLATLMLELNQVCASAKPHKPALEEFVAAKFYDGEQTLWYRGQVLEVTEQGYRILYVDYGNMDLVKPDGIAKLDPQFCSLPTMAIPCALQGMETVANNETLLSNFKIVLNRLVQVKAVSCQNGIYEVEMFLQDGTNLNSALIAVMNEINEEHAGTSTDTNKASRESQSVDHVAVDKALSDTSNSVNKSDGARSSSIAKISLPLDSEVAAITVHINSLASFFVQKSDQESATAHLQMMTELNQHCSNDTTPYSCQVSEFVAALFEEGGAKSWYRAEVMRIDTAGAVMKFIDYGNTDKVKFSDVRRLEPKFHEAPVTAIHCCLAGSDGADLPATIEEFNTILNHPVYLKVRHVDNDVHYVEMFLTNPEKTNVNTLLGLDPSKHTAVNTAQAAQDISTELTNMADKNVTKSTESKVESHSVPVLNKPDTRNVHQGATKDFPKPPKSLLEIGTLISGAAMSIDDVDSFYFMYGDIGIQRLLAELMTNLTIDCKEKPAGYAANVGEYVAAFYSENGTDEFWYRGVVKEICDNGKFKVHYIDYGNHEIVEAKHIKKLEDAFLDLPAFSTHCKIAGCEQLGEDSRRQFKAFEGVSLSVKAEREVDGIYEVQVFNQDNKNIFEIISGGDTRKPLAVSTTVSASTELVDQLPRPQTPVGKERLPKKSASPQAAERLVVFSQTITKSRPDGKEFEVVITSPVRPNLFHCQLIDKTNIVALKLLSDNMKIDCEETLYDGSKTKFEVGEMCCAKFVDGDWYRATILDVFPDNTVSVEYVDFGNRSEVNVENLRPVRPEYTELPLLAFRCTLHGVVSLESSWSKTAVAEFSKFADKPLMAKTISVTNDVYEVEMTDADGVNIAQYLIQARVAKKQQDEEIDDKEKMRRENELLRRQLEEMQSQMAKMKMNK